MTTNKDKKECEGCTTNKFCIIEPLYTNPKTNETIKCPCTTCLIKTICMGGDLVCKEYIEYIDSIRRYEAAYKIRFEKGT